MAPIAAALAREGINVDATEGCPAGRATVERRDGELLVTITDTAGRTSERSVSSVESVAALVASWTRGDLIEPLLAGPMVEPEAAPAVAAESPPAVALAAPAEAPLVGLDVAAETLVAFDASVWFGAHLAGCVRLGPTCLGAMARFAADAELSGDAESVGSSRLGLDVLLVVDFPVDLGPLSLVPGIGFGAGWMRAASEASRSEGDDNIDVDGGGMRADAHLTLTVPLGADFAIDAGLGVDVWILAHTGTYLEEGVTLAGEPRGRVRASVGLRYGAT